MLTNDRLKLHFVNVNHGDATIIEFPDYGKQNTAHFGVVDFGAKLKEDRKHARDYLDMLVKLRDNGVPGFDFAIEFVCVTHPHDDHYGGLKRFMDKFADPDVSDKNKVRRFWDCGFRTTSVTYNKILEDVQKNKEITFTRISAGSEYQFGETTITVLAPSIDLRNRFDTYGIDRNNSSIVLRIKYRNSYIILAADAEYASWGKITEEFPRQQRIKLHDDALGLAQRKDTSEQLKCNLLKIAHHGSKHGTSLEYLERLQPKHVVIPAGDDSWYQNNVPDWANYFPHPLVTKTLETLKPAPTSYVTGEKGNIIFKYTGGWDKNDIKYIDLLPSDHDFETELHNKWKDI